MSPRMGRPNDLITQKGCDMIANKLTGKKGVLFTAAYVSAFEDMQKALPVQPKNRIPERVSLGGLARLLSITRRKWERRNRTQNGSRKTRPEL